MNFKKNNLPSLIQVGQETNNPVLKPLSEIGRELKQYPYPAWQRWLYMLVCLGGAFSMGIFLFFGIKNKIIDTSIIMWGDILPGFLIFGIMFLCCIVGFIWLLHYSFIGIVLYEKGILYQRTKEFTLQYILSRHRLDNGLRWKYLPINTITKISYEKRFLIFSRVVIQTIDNQKYPLRLKVSSKTKKEFVDDIKKYLQLNFSLGK
ncbi:hypothetical protein KGV55_02680 [Candidatus Gracilibacteria bacterium]|nr:hypothetical protein [Candidatus Gracilibacteria bacterium]